MTRKFTVKKEIRTLGIDLCNPKHTIGAIVRGGIYLDGVAVLPTMRLSSTKTVASAIVELRFFPELRLIMVHDPQGHLDPKILKRLTKLPVIKINSSGAKNVEGYLPYRFGRKILLLKSSLEVQILRQILATTWTTGILPEPLRIAHLVANSPFFREKNSFSG